MRFLLTRRWLGFLLVVGALAYLALRLGDWQFHRLDDRRAANSRIVHNLADSPVPVADVLAVGRGATESDEWRQVTATGKYDDEHTVVVRYRTREGASGVDVVTPLVTNSGDAVLVDRGWMAAENSGARRPDLPPATGGLVTVTGYVRVDATGGSTQVTDLSTRSISSRAIGSVVPYPLFGGFLELARQSPRADKPLGRGGAARDQRRTALLLRPPVVVLRAARDRRLRLPRVRRVAAAAHPVRGRGPCPRRPAASRPTRMTPPG